MKVEHLIAAYEGLVERATESGISCLHHHELIVVFAHPSGLWLFWDSDRCDSYEGVKRVSLVVLDSDNEDEEYEMDQQSIMSDRDHDQVIYIVANIPTDQIRSLASSARVIWTHPAPEKNQ